MDLDVSGHVVMLYYKDMEKAREFYGTALSLTASFVNDWVTVFQVTPKSYIGTVKEGGAGGFHKTQENNAVMVSLETSDIDRWYEHLKSYGDIHFIKDLYQATTLPMQAFLMLDPGGYTVEFFQWNENSP